MKTLIIEQHFNSNIKVWKLKPDEKSYYTFGCSRTADLLSIDPSLGLWECVFEYSNNQWKYIDFNQHNFNKNVHPTVYLEKEHKIERKNSFFVLKVIEKNIVLNSFSDLTSSSDLNSTSDLTTTSTLSSSDSANTKNYQVFQVYYLGNLLETAILKREKKFKPESIPGKVIIDTIPSDTWKESTHNDYLIRQKSIKYKEHTKLRKIPFYDFIDKDSQKGALGLFLFCLVFAITMFLLPKQEKYVPVNSRKAVATQIILKNEFKKEKNKVEKKVKNAKKSLPTVATNEPNSEKPKENTNKVAGLLKNVNTGRISTLLSKVSAQGQKSKNVILSQGVVAGTAPSGRALAAIGNIDKSGSDWSTQTQSKGFKISTKGVGGGNSTSGFGKLQGGNVGQGGVGLIEDESEVVGGLDRDEIASYIKTQLGQILYCYERQLSANKDLFGKVSVKFTIGGTGKVEAQSINDTTLKNSNVEGCMLSKISSWKFPVPRGGTKVVVTYPFLFKSTN